MLVLDAIAVAAVLFATITDLLEEKIYNLLTFPLMLVGILAWPLLDASQWWQGIGGIFAVAPAFILLALHAVKAADVKLWMGVGALLGVRLGAISLLISIMVWAPIAIVVLAYNKRLLGVLRVLRGHEKPLVLPYGVSIALGTLITLAKYR